MTAEHDSLSTPLVRRVRAAIAEAGGWLPFDRFMALALYEPGLGYYARGASQIGRWPSSGPASAAPGAPAEGSDFVTAPELSPLFGAALAVQVRQALDATDTDTVWEFGAGTGALAAQLIEALGDRLRRYVVVELSGALSARQRERLASHGDRVHWVGALPARIDGVVVGNEVLDAMPVQLLHWNGRAWHERGVVDALIAHPRGVVDALIAHPRGVVDALTAHPRGVVDALTAHPRGVDAARIADLGDGGAMTQAGDPGRAPFAWADRPTDLRPPLAAGWPPGSVTEVHPQALAFVRTLAERLGRGAAFFVDYGFPEAEYYHPQRHQGTLMCHRAHRADPDPLCDVGEKDITAHVDFSAVALTAQDAGLEVLGYTSQARFLINCGLPALMAAADLPGRLAARRLIDEHEMGELFKVIGLAKGVAFDAVGFAAGDRTHRL